MRRILLILLLAPCALLHVHAYDFEVNGICYGFAPPRYAYVTHHGEWAGEATDRTYSGNLVVPSEISYNGRTYTVTSVGENAFAGCDELVSVQFPSTIRAVSSCAFLGCTNLQQVSLPATILAFGGFAFTGCTSLQQITLPRHTELVDSLTFYCCSSLTSVVLPHRIRTVCQGAMEHLPEMTDLYCFSSIPPVAEQGAFTLSDQQNCTLHVPAEAINLYQQSPVWSNFYRIVALSDENYTSQNYQRGDINDDGRIDAEDLALLRKLIVCLSDNVSVRWAADINGDGVVNAIDYVTLAKRI